mmetsp:Transcript_99645/g.277474  ORF Transcript_99645/g.277474 Transcript_99645/m.277474 type:complete len:288 (-) Transcript_99645:777-1640(-)
MSRSAWRMPRRRPMLQHQRWRRCLRTHRCRRRENHRAPQFGDGQASPTSSQSSPSGQRMRRSPQTLRQQRRWWCLRRCHRQASLRAPPCEGGRMRRAASSSALTSRSAWRRNALVPSACPRRWPHPACRAARRSAGGQASRAASSSSPMRCRLQRSGHSPWLQSHRWLHPCPRSCHPQAPWPAPLAGGGPVSRTGWRAARQSLRAAAAAVGQPLLALPSRPRRSCRRLLPSRCRPSRAASCRTHSSMPSCLHRRHLVPGAERSQRQGTAAQEQASRRRSAVQRCRAQ